MPVPPEKTFHTASQWTLKPFQVGEKSFKLLNMVTDIGVAAFQFSLMCFSFDVLQL